MKQVRINERLPAHGNAAAEYALVGTLICVVSLGALLSFSGAFSARISDIKSDMIAKADKTSQENAIRAAQMGLNTPAGSGSACIDAWSGNGSGATATTGANGNTWGLEGRPGGSAPTKESNLTPAQEKIVTAIANNAHEVAQLQKILRQIAKLSRGNRETFRKTTVVYNGTVLSAGRIAAWLKENGYMSARLQTLVDKLAATGADKGVLSEVNTLTGQVSSDAATSSNAAQSALTNAGSPTTVVVQTNPVKTDQNAAAICETAGGTDTGTRCGV
ncbi:hypothetical protein [Vampirovibrio chlorellavorus]|uniref:hypothetical protein n=1 Tax=Vampirovibrio chlorellavorus TaxID=758823 RepID=UPI0026F2C33C|nr:hypothetical protein [Vampirovibrio chlorellavorus]